jgi:hypothetical protein
MVESMGFCCVWFVGSLFAVGVLRWPALALALCAGLSPAPWKTLISA